MYKVNKDDCCGCGSCVEQCPNTAITLVNGVAIINQDDCVQCGACQSVCPCEAIKEGE